MSAINTMHPMDEIEQTLRGLRAPIQQGEYDLHALVMRQLTDAGIAFTHEAKLAPRCRIDLLAGGIGIEIKRGKLAKTKLLEQLSRYAACDAVTGLVLVAEQTVALPKVLNGKPVRGLFLNRLWGIAL